MLSLSLLCGLILSGYRGAHAQIPATLLGKWRIERILPTQRAGCWPEDRAKNLLGSTLTYEPAKMIWEGGEIPLNGVLAITRTLNRKRFSSEYGVDFDELQVHAPTITEIDLQHEDADITGATTEVPGDTVVLAGPSRIVVSACGVFYEALRVKR